MPTLCIPVNMAGVGLHFPCQNLLRQSVAPWQHDLCFLTFMLRVFLPELLTWRALEEANKTNCPILFPTITYERHPASSGEHRRGSKNSFYLPLCKPLGGPWISSGPCQLYSWNESKKRKKKRGRILTPTGATKIQYNPSLFCAQTSPVLPYPPHIHAVSLLEPVELREDNSQCMVCFATCGNSLKAHNIYMWPTFTYHKRSFVTRKQCKAQKGLCMKLYSSYVRMHK